MIVTVMLPQRQVPVSLSENLEGSWDLGSPVGSLGIVNVDLVDYWEGRRSVV